MTRPGKSRCKKIILSVILGVFLVGILCTATACSLSEHNLFVYVDDELFATYDDIPHNSKIKDKVHTYLYFSQDNILKRKKLTVLGWYYDKEFTQPIVFDKTKVTGDITAYAKYDDPNKVVNTVTYNFPSGDGTENNPYLIKTAQDLNAIGEGTGIYHKLANDIDLSRFNNVDSSATVAQWKSIKTYDGHLDGNGHTISGFNFFNMTGILGFINVNKGEIKNLTISCEFSFNTSVAKNTIFLLCDTNEGAIKNCRFSGSVIISNLRNFAMIGSNEAGGVVENCKSDLTVSASGKGSDYNSLLSLLICDNYGKVKQCSTSGCLIAEDRPSSALRKASGICLYNEGTIDQCRNAATIRCFTDWSTGYNVAAWAAGISITNKGTISNCYNTGNITANGAYAYAAGLSTGSSGFLKYCYVDAEIIAAGTISSSGHRALLFRASDSNDAQAARSLELVFDKSKYKNEYTYSSNIRGIDPADSSEFSNWDTDIWAMRSGTFPELKFYNN